MAVAVVEVLPIMERLQAVLAQPIKVMQEKHLILQSRKPSEALAVAVAQEKLVVLMDVDSAEMALLHP
jgi:hypothetical protein